MSPWLDGPPRPFPTRSEHGRPHACVQPRNCVGVKRLIDHSVATVDLIRVFNREITWGWGGEKG